MATTDLWKAEAYRRFPELHVQFSDADTPYLLWFELRDAFHDAYSRLPLNEGLIKQIYDYADWCCSQPRGDTAEDDLLTCVAVAFYEHIPESPAAVADMPRWFTLEDVGAMKEVLSYHVGFDGYKEILDAYARKKR